MTDLLATAEALDVAGVKKRFEQALSEISEDTPAEQVAYALMAVDFLLELSRAVRSLRNRVVIDWIERNGELTIGEDRYYVGIRKRTKVRDAAATLDALLEFAGGDLHAVAEALSSEPVKQGTFKTLLGVETWREHFRVEPVQELRTGKPRKELKKSNQFTRS